MPAKRELSMRQLPTSVAASPRWGERARDRAASCLAAPPGKRRTTARRKSSGRSRAGARRALRGLSRHGSHRDGTAPARRDARLGRRDRRSGQTKARRERPSASAASRHSRTRPRRRPAGPRAGVRERLGRHRARPDRAGERLGAKSRLDVDGKPAPVRLAQARADLLAQRAQARGAAAATARVQGPGGVFQFGQFLGGRRRGEIAEAARREPEPDFSAVLDPVERAERRLDRVPHPLGATT